MPFLQFSGPSRTPRTFLGSFLVLDIRLISPVAYSASIYCPCHLHTLFMALKRPNTCQNDTTTHSHQNTQVSSGVTYTPQITSHKHLIISLHPSQTTSPLCQTTPNNACKHLHRQFTLSKISYALRFKLS